VISGKRYKKYNRMKIIGEIIMGLIVLEHMYFLWLEMFAWETKGKEVFKDSLPAELFKPTKVLAANQGLYNGFLAAGLIWALLIPDPHWRLYVSVFFLTCVIVAGIYGAVTAGRKIFFVQALPAIVALILVHF
jgi:putative membrane protein